MFKKAYKKLWIVKRLKALGADSKKLVDVYVKQVRSILELAVPAWHSSLTIADSTDIERVQRSALKVILGMNFKAYQRAMEELNLVTLEERRITRFNFSSVSAKFNLIWFS